MYLFRIQDKEQLRIFMEALAAHPAAQKLARKLGSYINEYPLGHCADCGVLFEAQEQLVSPDSSELHEVMLEGMQAIEAKPRIVCRPCWQKAAERRVAEQAQGL